MSTLFQAVNSTAETTNGAVTNHLSLNKNVDMFFLAGASRGKDITSTFAAALVEDPEVAVRIAMWARDIRGGSGERQTFRNLFSYLVKSEPPLAARVLTKIPEIGRWDDVLVAFGTTLEREALRMISFALNDVKDGLCAKWMPRQGAEANKIRSYLKLTPKEYRKLVVGLSKTVEQQMCAQDWTGIEYSHVPSIAAARYQKAFGKHDPVGYESYKAKLAAGTATINASAVFPYTVVNSVRNGDAKVANAQWKALPDYLAGSSESLLPIVDVSGSMDWFKVSGSVTGMDVALSLGIYLSERSEGIFKDQFMTFSSAPRLVQLKGTLEQRVAQMQGSDVGGNTNLTAAFRLILDSAKKANLPASELPTTVLILSDMEFDSCITTGSNTYGGGVSVSAMEYIKTEYETAGYKCPQVVFWNLNGRAGNSPVTYNESGTALISGFSPSIVKSLLGGDEMTPMSIMLKTVMAQRYDF